MSARDSRKVLKAAWLVVPALALAAGAWVRVAQLPRDLNAQPANLTGAIAAHYLPLTDLNAHVLDSWWKFMFHGEHALGDFFWYYLVIWLFTLFGIGITPWNIYASNAVLNLGCVCLTYVFGRQHFSALVGMIASVFLLVSWKFTSEVFYTFNFSFIIALTLATMLAIRWYYRRRGIVPAVVATGTVFLAAGTELLFLLPIFVWYAWVVSKVEPAPPSIFWRRVGWWPLLVAATSMAVVIGLVHLRLGPSNLGMFGRFFSHYVHSDESTIRLATVFPQAAELLRETLDSRLTAALLATAVAVHVALVVTRRTPLRSYSTFVLGWFLLMLVASASTVMRTHLVIVQAVLLLGWYSAKTLRRQRRGMLYGTALVLVCLAGTTLGSARMFRRYQPENLQPFRAVSYFIRTNGARYAKVYNLNKDVNLNLACQYYYGKNYQRYDPPTRPSRVFTHDKKLYKLIFSSLENPLQEMKSLGKLDKMDFFVLYEGSVWVNKLSPEEEAESAAILHDAGVRPVAAVVGADGSRRARIFSRHPIGYQVLDLETYTRKWDREIAHLYTIYEHHRIGVADHWGHWDLPTRDIE